MTTTTPLKVALVAFDGISAFHLSVPCLVFQDGFLGQPCPFDLTICSPEGPNLETSSGFAVRINRSIDAIDCADIIVIPSWPNALPPPPTPLIDKLKSAHQRGALLVGLCLGAFVIAETGLLDGQTATTHWAFVEQFSQRFPKVTFDSQPLFIEHPQLITSAGTAASLDCCLHVVRRFCGSDVTSQLARVLVTAPFRSGGQQQYIPSPIAPRPEQATSVSKVVEQVEQELNQSHSIETMAKRCAMSRRTFTRQFKASYGCTFGEWLLTQRLKLSQQYLEKGERSIAQVAELAGFGSESVYRKHFKAAFDVSPSQWRATFGGDKER
ncbi:helix-turn-helix domain-containing protein [Ferrimonas sp. YFM]|uniref:GlxA family transcriptional regulator n=1 Tax=Ferrimonas sp. YFM TaxID=3028878 RepID=UPI00257234E7|nr:helix-turn-helix domain-containing protein [Ferrimonas sp. YFM]